MARTVKGGCPARADGRVVGLTCLLVMVGGGCAPDAGDAGSDADQGGVLAVEEWVVGPEELRIGTLEGEGVALSMISDLVVAADRVYLLQPAAPHVLAFDREGRPLGEVGGEGEGPGEFAHATVGGLLGDTLWVWDAQLDRTTLFTSEGRRAGEIRMGRPEPEARFSESLVGLTDGRTRILSTTWSAMLRVPGLSESSADLSDPAPLLARSDGSPMPDTLAGLDREHSETVLARVMPTGQVAAIAFATTVVSDATLVALTSDRRGVLLVDRPIAADGGTAEYAVHRVDLSGDTVFSTTVSYEPRPLPASIGDSLVAAHEGRFDEDEVRAAYFLPDFAPPVSDLIAGTDGTVWVGRENVFGGPVGWDVFDEAGRLIARTEAPPGLRVEVASREELWGVVTDDFDVPYVVRHPVRPAG